MHDMSGRVAVITGAAGTLGAAVARLFHRAGARTVLVARDADRLRQLHPGLADSPDHLLAAIDLTDPAAVTATIDQARARFGRLDVLVAAAGGFRGGEPVQAADPADWEALFALNLRTALLCCRAAVPHFLAQGSGRIVTVGATAALRGVPGLGPYNASKSALLSLTQTLANELKPAGITVNAVLPGIIDTPENRAAMPEADRSTWVEPEAIAEVILFLASDAARAVTGAAIPVSGKG